VFSHILSISEQDEQYFKKKYPALQHAWIPAFHPNENVRIKTGKGSYCLYHGNLAVSENIKSVEFLLQEVFNKIEVPLIIAGKNPNKELFNHQQNQVQIIANPDTETLNDLIANAQIHVLPSFQQTGLKLKVLHALFQGRHCLLNDSSLESHLKTCIHFAETPDLFCAKIQELMGLDFTEQDILQRSEHLAFYNNHKQALRIADLLNITNIDHD